jgi:hypothetical protein
MRALMCGTWVVWYRQPGDEQAVQGPTTDGEGAFRLDRLRPGSVSLLARPPDDLEIRPTDEEEALVTRTGAPHVVLVVR